MPFWGMAAMAVDTDLRCCEIFAELLQKKTIYVYTTIIKGELRMPVYIYTIPRFIRFESIETSIFIHQNMKLLSKLSLSK